MFCFRKMYFSATFWNCFSCSRSSPSSSQSARSGLTCHKVFTGSCSFSRPLYYSNPGQSLALHLYLPFFCLLTATSLSNSLFHPASVESTETGTGIKLFQPVSLSQKKFLCSAILKSLRQYWHLTCFNLLRQSTCFVSKNVFVKCYLHLLLQSLFPLIPSISCIFLYA